MFKSPMSRFGAAEKTKEQPGHTSGRASNSSGDIRKSVTVNAHHDGHYSMQHEGGEPTHINAGDDLASHIFTALEPDEDDMASADSESMNQGTPKRGSMLSKK